MCLNVLLQLPKKLVCTHKVLDQCWIVIVVLRVSSYSEGRVGLDLPLVFGCASSNGVLHISIWVRVAHAAATCAAEARPQLELAPPHLQ